MFDVKTVSLEWGGKTLTLETGRSARQADGEDDSESSLPVPVDGD